MRFFFVSPQFKRTFSSVSLYVPGFLCRLVTLEAAAVFEFSVQVLINFTSGLHDAS